MMKRWGGKMLMLVDTKNNTWLIVDARCRSDSQKKGSGKIPKINGSNRQGEGVGKKTQQA